MKAYKLLLTAAAATMLLSGLAASAKARTFSSTSQTWRASFREIRLAMPFGTGNCQITLEGSLHSRTMAKVVGSLVGYITRADVGPCASGRKTILRETLPWHIRYLSFTGTLPNITSIRYNIVGWSQRMSDGIVFCLYRSTAAEPAVMTFNREAGGALVTAVIGGTILSSCGSSNTITSSPAALTVLNSAARITVTLI